jgi:hypothetical protein
MNRSPKTGEIENNKRLKDVLNLRRCENEKGKI